MLNTCDKNRIKTPFQMDDKIIHLDFSNTDFVLKAQQQIEKDFAKFNLYFPESFVLEPLSKESIEELVGENIATVMKYGGTQLMQLLYTIDVPEKDFLHLITSSDFIENISKMILKREAMKVFYRMKYSSSILT